MATPQPILKPQFQTSVTATLVHTYEVLVAATPRGLPLSPRPRVAYTPEDAVLALAQMLKANRLTPDDMLAQFPENQFMVALRVILTCDGVTHEQLYKAHQAFTHDVTLSKLRAFYPDARPMVLANAELAPDTSAPIEDEERMSVLHNSGAQSQTPQRRRPEPPKQRRVITTYQGNDAEEQIGDALKGLIAEDIPKGGMILTTGKQGVRIVDASRSREIEGEGYVSVTMNDTRAHSAPSQEITIHRDPNTLPPGVPDPRRLPNVAPAPKKAAVRTITGDEAEGMVVKPLTLPKQTVVTEDGRQIELTPAQINQLMAQQMGGAADEPVPVVKSAEALLGETDEAPDHDVNRAEGQAKATHKVKVPKMRQEGRGGTRPKKEDLPK